MEKISKIGKILGFLTALFVILLGAISRILPHPPNFAPIGALALFGGVYFSKKIALVLPIFAMIVGDIFIGFYQPILMITVYLSFLICVFFGFWLKKNKNWSNILRTSMFSSIIFYLLTNFAVWAFTGWYPKTLFGLIQSYLMALPFLRNTFFGDLFYTTLFFGVYELFEIWVRKKLIISETTPASRSFSFSKI